MNGAELVGKQINLISSLIAFPQKMFFSQKKKCTRYKNDEKESPPNIVSPENTVYYPVYNVYRPYMPLVNVMLGY